MRLFQVLSLGAAIAFGSASLLQAHEFWIEPESFVLKAGQTLRADLKVGQDFGGSKYPYVKRNFRSFEVTDTKGTRSYGGLPGDLPAMQLGAPKAGLNIISYHSTDSTLTFNTWELFEKYTNYEGLPWAQAAHRDAGLPETGFKERYARNAKALVQVGPYQGGQDQRIGMPAEFVALNSPYAPDTDEVRVKMLWQGKPVADWAVNVFAQNKSGALKTSQVRTDAQGVVTVPFAKNTRVMLNAVYLRRTDKSEGAVWESWWPNLTFGRH